MKVIYSDQSLLSLEESLDFTIEQLEVPPEKVSELIQNLFNRADSLGLNPYKGQKENDLEHLQENHRRLIEGNFKIIYKIENDSVYITDFFYSRQDPHKMKG
jgi:plasmid stabilization system protein ParE